MAAAFLLFGVALVYGGTSTTHLDGILIVLNAGIANNILVLSGAALILVGLSFKLAAAPFHVWSPDVYQGAPSPVTGFMSVGAKAAAVAALLRVFMVTFEGLAADISPILWGLAALTMVVGNVAAIVQNNIKRMLAYSSVAHGGYMLMAFVPYGVAAVADDSMASMLFYLVVYAITSFGAWAVVILLERAEGKGLELSDYAGLGRQRPWVALAMMIFMLSFTGMPLTLGFWGKFYLFRTAVQGGFVGLAVVGLLTSVASAFYYLRVIIIMYMKPGEPELQENLPMVNLMVGISAVAVVLLSFIPTPLLDLALRVMLHL